MHPVIARYIEAYNAMDVDGMMATLHHDVLFENFAKGEITASARSKEALRAFEGVLASGETIALTGTSEFHLRDGLIDAIVDWS